MSKCKQCNIEFVPCANYYSEELGRWGTYACCETHARQYIDLVKENRMKNKKNMKSSEEVNKETFNQVQEEGIIELQSSRLEQYIKQDEIVESEVVEEIPKPSYTRRRKNT